VERGGGGGLTANAAPLGIVSAARGGCLTANAAPLAVGAADPKVRLCDMRSGLFTHTLYGPNSHRDDVYAVAWSPRNQHLLATARYMHVNHCGKNIICVMQYFALFMVRNTQKGIQSQCYGQSLRPAVLGQSPNALVCIMRTAEWYGAREATLHRKDLTRRSPLFQPGRADPIVGHSDAAGVHGGP
jgi:hypothetical protein